jgi:ABC-2 type transport system permease protein
MTTWTEPRPEPSTIQQWWVLTARVIAPTLRNGELLIAISLSVVFTVSLYLPLKQIMSTVVHGSYAQYMMPMIALQAIFFAAMSAAIRSANDSVHGINVRFRALPIAPMTPLAARMAANAYRCATALVTALLCGYVIGFRFYLSGVYTLTFCLLILVIGIVLSFVGDLIGAVSRNPEATTHMLLLPQLILGMLSVGILPPEQFPGWLQPFVRNQFYSQFVYALRALAGDESGSTPWPTWSVVGPSLVWLAGLMLVALPLYALVLRRQR